MNRRMNVRTRTGCAAREDFRAAASRRGFTLVEVLLVLGIVGIIMTIAVPGISPDRWRSDGAVQSVAIAMNAAQRTAVLRQHDVIMTFDMDADVIQVHLDTDNDGSVDSGEATRMIDMPETIGFANSGATELPQGSAPISWAPASGDPILTFYRNGSTSSEGAVYLSPTRGRKKAVATSARAVTVERATGVVRCWSFRNATWEEAC